MQIAAATAWIFLVPVLPVALWVAWSDLRFMRIPNRAVYTLVAIFAVAGLAALPVETWLWRWAQLAVVLAAGFLLNLARTMGAGDAKFLAAMAPFVDRDDALALTQVFAAVLLAAFATHRLFRAIPAIRRATADWRSWTHAKFPMGLALSGAFLIYLGLGTVLGA